MPKIDMQWTITPQIFLSLGNMLLIAGIGWGLMQGSSSSLSKAMVDLKADYERRIDRAESDIRLMRAQDTSIAVLKVDVQYIKDSIARIERAVAVTSPRSAQ